MHPRFESPYVSPSAAEPSAAGRYETFVGAANEKETWSLAYTDLLTVLLTLFVILLAASNFSDNNAEVNEAPTTTTETAPKIESVVPPKETNELAVPPVAESRAEIPSESPEPVSAPVAEAPKNENVMQSLLEQLEITVEGAPIVLNQRHDSLEISVVDNVFFAPGDTELSANGLRVLAQLTPLLTRDDYLISVEGHTDNIPVQSPRFASNWELSTTRATTVTRFLIEHGIASNHIRAIGYADTQPVASNETVEGRARNRRVNLVVTQTSISTQKVED